MKVNSLHTFAIGIYYNMTYSITYYTAVTMCFSTDALDCCTLARLSASDRWMRWHSVLPFLFAVYGTTFRSRTQCDWQHEQCCKDFKPSTLTRSQTDLHR